MIIPNLRFTPGPGLFPVSVLCFLMGFLLLKPVSEVSAQNNTPDETIELKAIGGLQYDQVRIVVQPGKTVKIILENTDDMLHNMLIVRPGTREQVVAEAEAMGHQGLEKSFIPQSSDVLAAIPLVDSGDKASVVFEVPEKEGAYPYVCTYPAHGLVMYGVMHVTNSPDLLPPIEEDENVPEMRRKRLWMPIASFHPYPMEMPQVNRLFMPEASPASIAVGMEKNQSYCWDAGVCHLRYAWRGGYIDPSEQWTGKSDKFAKINGEIYYKNEVGFPFRIGKSDLIPEPQFKGYQLVNDYPQFIYQTDDVIIRELIRPAGDSPGLEITYHIENITEPVWYAAGTQPGVTTEASAGEWEGNLLRLSPEQAKEFTITIIPE